jgi:osmoprotectant transport system permease protein
MPLPDKARYVVIGAGIHGLSTAYHLAAQLRAKGRSSEADIVVLDNVDPALREAARGMGMTPLQRLKGVELPIALPVIINGVRNAVVLSIAVAAIATYIGAGGLGTFISRGISQTDIRQLLTGALAVSVLAIIADYVLLALQRALTPPGLRA